MPSEVSLYNNGPVMNQAGGNQYIQHQSVISTSNDIGPGFFKTSTYKAHKDFNPARVQNTCQWFLDHHRFQGWRNSDHHDLLWLSGRPGCGKSVLSKALIDDELVGSKSATICYFFFKDNEEQNATATAICAILHQLFCAKEGLFQKYALKQIIQHGDNLKVDFETLWQVWISAAYDPSTGDVICILDALDECRQPDRNRLIQELERFYTTYREKVDGRSKLKFLITSRPYGDIKRGFGNMIYEHPTTQLAADDESKIISHEIRMVMDATVDKIVKARRLTNDIGIALKRRLSEVPSTTYLWLHLVLDEIQRYHGGTEKKLLRKINELPETVEDAYEKILERCNKGTRHDAKRLLEIIVAAQRPLTLSEIDVVLEIKTDPDSRSCDDLDLEGANREQWILDTCSLFVSIIDSRIYLIHQTAREFLLRKWNERAATKGWRYSIDLQNAHLALSKLCLVYLHFKDFQRDYQEITLDLVPEEAFLRYSANHWIYHLQQADTIEWQWVNRAAKLCDVRDGSNSLWVRYYSHNIFWRQSISQNQSSFFWAATWGLLRVLELLLRESNLEINEDVIKAAASNSRCGADMIKLLLDRRPAEVEITNEVVITAVSNTFCGDAMIKLLLDRRPEDVKITNEVVIAAASNSFRGDAIMELLLDRRPDEVKITDEVVNTAVSDTFCGDAMIKLLLNRRPNDVKINEDVIKAAVSNTGCGVAMIKLLFDQRPNDVKITHGVVMAAVSNPIFGKDVMKLLLNRRPDDVKITDGVVMAAVSNRRSGKGIMKLLLDQRPDDVKIANEVVIAAVRYREDTMKLLLDRRPDDVKITDEVVITTAKYGEATMKLLLDRRPSDVKITNEVVITAVSNTFCGDAMTKLLLDRRPNDVKITDEVIMAAASNSFRGDAIMELLLDWRLNSIKITNRVVIAAAKCGEDIMKLLLDRRPDDIKITDEVVITTAKNREATMKLLLDRRPSDVKITNEMVIAAASNSFRGDAMMKLLFDRRPDEVKITDEVVMAAASTMFSGEETMKLLLNRRPNDVNINEDVIKAAVSNTGCGEAMVKLLLDRRPDDVKITDEVVIAAASNSFRGDAIMELLLDRRPDDVKITDEVVMAAMSNTGCGKDLMKLLLDRRPDDVKIYR